MDECEVWAVRTLWWANFWVFISFHIRNQEEKLNLMGPKSQFQKNSWNGLHPSLHKSGLTGVVLQTVQVTFSFILTVHDLNNMPFLFPFAYREFVFLIENPWDDKMFLLQLFAEMTKLKHLNNLLDLNLFIRHLWPKLSRRFNMVNRLL